MTTGRSVPEARSGRQILTPKPAGRNASHAVIRADLALVWT